MFERWRENLERVQKQGGIGMAGESRRLTQEHLEAIRKRAEAATEGPWYWENDAELRSRTTPDAILEAAEGKPGDLFIDAWERDETFIAHAREDIPALLAEVVHYSGKISFYLDEIERLRAVVVEKDVEIAKKDSEIERLRAVIVDFADYGTRHDTNPTIGGRIKRFDDAAGWVAYIRSMDGSVRRRAKEALGE